MEVTPIGQHPKLVEAGPTHADGKGPKEKGVGVRSDSISISEAAEQHQVVLGAQGGAKAGQSDLAELELVGGVGNEKHGAEAELDIVGKDADDQTQVKLIGPSSDAGNTREAMKLRQLQERHAEVHAHERAHAGAGGRWMHGGAKYQFVTGPDGKQYALGGESQIDLSPIADDPMATIQKMQQVRRAALAPLQPSSQDRVVARQAAMLEVQAREMLQISSTESSTHNNLGIGGESAGAIIGSVKAQTSSKYEPALPEPLDIIGEERGIFAPPDAQRTSSSLASYQKVQPVTESDEQHPKNLNDTVA